MENVNDEDDDGDGDGLTLNFLWIFINFNKYSLEKEWSYDAMDKNELFCKCRWEIMH